VLTLIGIAASRSSTTDIRIAANQIPFKRNFFFSEGGASREMMEVGAGNYPVLGVTFRHQVADETGQMSGAALPPPAPHDVAGTPYNFELWYEGNALPPAGYSPLHFSRYDFSAADVHAVINAVPQRVRVDCRFYRIGPKAS
jgi:hypothetical protein